MLQILQEKYRPYIPEEKIDALFMFQAGTVWASIDSVYRSCMEDERFCVKLALVEETTVETSHMVGAKNFLEEEKLDYCRYEDIDFDNYCPHVVFIQFPYDAAFHTPETLSIQFKRRGSRFIYIPYGIEISDTEIARKDHFHSFVVENAWRVYTSCEGIKEEYEKYCHNRKAVRVTGSPKFDAITYKESIPLKSEIVEKSRGRKIVVWKMHFPKKINEKGQIKQITPYMKEYIEFAKQVEEYTDLFFIVLAHPKMLKSVVASDILGDDSLVLQTKEIIEILREKENVYIDGDDDYRNSFYNADAIMMDRSAVMIEAGMLDIPVLLMKNQDYSETMTIPVENVVSSFCQGSVCEDMREFIDDFQNGIDSKAESRRNSIQLNFPFNDGLCGFRIREDIVKGLSEQVCAPKVILYGTGEICRYYMEIQKWGQHQKFDLIALADSNEIKWGTTCFGTPVVSEEELKHMEFDAIVITTEPHYFEIKKSLVYDMYLDERKIWRLDEFVVALDYL